MLYRPSVPQILALTGGLGRVVPPSPNPACAEIYAMRNFPLACMLRFAYIECIETAQRHTGETEMTTIATALNAKGQAHVTAELARLGLNWNVDATMTEIESMPDFGNVLTVGEVKYETPNGDIYIKAEMVMTESVE